MTLIVEDGTGVLDANSYAGIAYAQKYLTERNQFTDSPWAISTRAVKEAALISATDYIDKRFGLKFLGSLTFTNLEIPSKNYLIISALPAIDDTITLNETVYTFKTLAALPNEITIAVSTDLQATAIVVASSIQTDMVLVSVGSMIFMKAVEAGENSYPTSSTCFDFIFETETLTGGTLEGVQSLCFPRTSFVGIPEVLKMATIEYAIRSLTDDLMPDPIVDESGQAVRRRSEKVGPVEEEIVYQNSGGAIFKIYPEADYLLKSLISSNLGVYV